MGGIQTTHKKPVWVFSAAMNDIKRREEITEMSSLNIEPRISQKC
jgi:hypothetical protein